MSLKVDMGCGKMRRKSWLGIDLFDYTKFYGDGDFICHDLSTGIPLKDDSVSEFYSAHCIEHLPDKIEKIAGTDQYRNVDALDFIMREIHRVCKKGAKIQIRLPIYSITDGHVRFFNVFALQDFTDASKAKSVITTPLFHLVKRELVLYGYWRVFFPLTWWHKFFELSPFKYILKTEVRIYMEVLK